jgi:hypothetical protein
MSEIKISTNIANEKIAAASTGSYSKASNNKYNKNYHIYIMRGKTGTVATREASTRTAATRTRTSRTTIRTAKTGQISTTKLIRFSVGYGCG